MLTSHRKTRLAEVLQEQSEITWRKAQGYDAIAAYEKRLVTIASGDSVVKAASRAQKAQDKADREEADVNVLEPALAPKTPERPRPLRRTRANPVLSQEVRDADKEPTGDGEEEQQEEIQQDDVPEDAPAGDREAEETEQVEKADIPGDEQDDAMIAQDEQQEEAVVNPQEDSTRTDTVQEDATEQDPTQGSPEPQADDEEPLIDPASPVASDGPAFSEPPSPRRLTRASSAVSFGDVQPAKRIRRR